MVNFATSGDAHGNLDKRVAVLVLHYDALDVAFVDQGADLIDEVAAQDMYFFHNIIEIHTLDYVVACRQVPKQLHSEDKGAVSLPGDAGGPGGGPGYPPWDSRGAALGYT
jgi:hypothetical protein